MKTHLIILLLLFTGLSTLAQKSNEQTSSLWIIVDSVADLTKLDYYLYQGSNLISTIKSDSLVKYNADPQKYELQLPTAEHTIVINKLLNVPVVITNIEFKNRMITWLKMDMVVREAKKISDFDRNVMIIDYESVRINSD